MSDIILATINARYIHASLGLRYLYANLGELQHKALIQEFEVRHSAIEIAEQVLEKNPKIVGFGVYIWNVQRTTEVVRILKKVNPELCIIVGGPEVSFNVEDLELVKLSDYTIQGEADHSFRELCLEIFSGVESQNKIRSSKLPDLATIQLPYNLYSDSDCAHRVVYIEASRGCPFTCQFCLSSLDIPVRKFDTDQMLVALSELYDRGLRIFKFVDRTFNLNLQISSRILNFFLERYEPGLFVHFEMVPDRFPTALRELVEKFPVGSLQFEVGIQSFNQEVNALIKRRQDITKLKENILWLRQSTGVYIHADLIAGLPGEDINSFGLGFDELVKLNPQEIQVGILKKLRGAPIEQHDETWKMVYSPDPPYEVLSTKTMVFGTLQKMRRFSRYWDLVANSGNFLNSKQFLWHDEQSPFEGFLHFSEWLFVQVKRRDSINLKTLTEQMYIFLTTIKSLDADEVGRTLVEDYCRGGRVDVPRSLLQYFQPKNFIRKVSENGLKRQKRVVESLTMSANVTS